jgi:hypothetical protein
MTGNGRGKVTKKKRGGRGAPAHPGRKSLELVEKMVRLADEIMDQDAEKICKFARNVLDDPDASPRDCVRVSQLLERFIQHGMQSTMHRENMAAKAQGLDQVQINVVYKEPEDGLRREGAQSRQGT